MKLKILFLVIILSIAPVTIGVAAASSATTDAGLNSVRTFLGYTSLKQGGTSVTCGDGDPVPGGGVPT
ncbi:MAG: hypothetical protein JSW72_06700 [Candidatus Bathyarchaeota archaeon]|nr:MAG: hypothetical protein JSW72_06700 [Candidatus Bathyarchaeota archaeon]